MQFDIGLKLSEQETLCQSGEHQFKYAGSKKRVKEGRKTKTIHTHRIECGRCGLNLKTKGIQHANLEQRRAIMDDDN